jgi:hypothetical protein
MQMRVAGAVPGTSSNPMRPQLHASSSTRNRPRILTSIADTRHDEKNACATQVPAPTRDPTNAMWQHELSLAHTTIVDAVQALDKPEAAVESPRDHE